MKIMSNITFRQKPERKAIRFTAVVFALTLAVLNLPTTTYAADVSHSSVVSAIANFFSTNPTTCDCTNDPPCIGTSVFVFATDNIDQTPPGPGVSSSSADIFIFQNDLCTDTVLLNAGCFPSVPLENNAFQVMGNLKSATLKTTLECSESVSDIPFDVDVDLKWTGTGDLLRGNSHSHSSFPGCIINSHSNGKLRLTMESGTVSDGITNFTPGPSVSDSGDNITSGKGGTVFIGCQ